MSEDKKELVKLMRYLHHDKRNSVLDMMDSGVRTLVLTGFKRNQ